MNTSSSDFHDWSPTPPMGWNSWDCYGPLVDEAAVRANAEWMARHLLRLGWEYCVVDIRWTVQNEYASTEYNETDPVFTLDEYGRYLPDPIRFPSSADGAGFAPLAAYVHSLGLKFGIHIMRGVPKAAVQARCPVLGAPGVTCDQIAGDRLECFWLPDNYTVLADRAGAQAYYDSLAALYASWGVDFIKCDDLSAPIYRADELEMLRRAIDRGGRPMVLSTSPGETPICRAAHVAANANMWRMVNDVWDTWESVTHLAPIVAAWIETGFPRGSWPDCDMLPFGAIRLRWHGIPERRCRLTPRECRSMMTLFSIVRSPLMFSGDLPALDDDPGTLSLLANEAVLHMHRTGTNPHAPLCTACYAVFTLDGADGDRYLALLNFQDREDDIPVPPELLPRAGQSVADLWSGERLPSIPRRLAAHDCALLRIE